MYRTAPGTYVLEKGGVSECYIGDVDTRTRQYRKICVFVYICTGASRYLFVFTISSSALIIR